ncbi:MAG: DUF2117 domain-containing protein [Candidatus Helarchaeota archaeon]
MKIGIIVHGPDVIDSGECSHVLNLFQDHDIIAKLGGIMGKTAVIDSNLEKIIDISENKRPSEQLDAFLSKDVDLIILVNHGKTLKTGIAFGGAVISNSLKYSNSIPIIQIERLLEKDGIVLAWNESGKKILKELEKVLKIPISEKVYEVPHRYKSEGGKNLRSLVGVNPNEKIFLNNVIIGYSKSDNVTIVEKDGKIIDIIGGKINPHGLEKIKQKINLKKAMIKTANFIRTKPPKYHRKIDRGINTNKIAILFNAENVYDIILKNFDLIISIGDDTTAIIADSASRFNIPVIGIIDGDMDCLLNSIHKNITLNELGSLLSLAKNSLLIQVTPGWDDKIGIKIKSSIFNNKEILELDKNQIDSIKEKINAIASDYIVSKYEKL